MVKLYGIPNCDTVKKALTYFKEKQIPVEFHNFKTSGISAEKLETWLSEAGLNKIVNKSSTTYRSLNEEAKAALQNVHTAIAVLQENPSAIKRPVTESQNRTLVGFKKEEYDALFS